MCTTSVTFLSGDLTKLLSMAYRKALILATGVIVAGGTAAYVKSRFNCKKHDSFGQYNGVINNEGNSELVINDGKRKKTPEKRGGLKSLKLLAAILLSQMGKMGARDLLSLVGIVVS